MRRVELILTALVALSPLCLSQATPPVDPSALHVTGLTQLNAGVAEIALEGLAHRAFHCVDCDVTQAGDGPCPVCRGALIPIDQTLLCAVEVDVAAGTIHFDVVPEQRVRLTEIQAALTRFKIAIPAEQQFIPHRATLLVAGPVSKEEVDKLAAELRDTNLFEKLTASFDAAGKQAELTVECVGSPPRPQVEEALVKAGANYKLADIGWSAGSSTRSGRN